MNAKPQEHCETLKKTGLCGLCGREGEALAEAFRRFRFHGSPGDWLPSPCSFAKGKYFHSSWAAQRTEGLHSRKFAIRGFLLLKSPARNHPFKERAS
jgi:hypothetical protein